MRVSFPEMVRRSGIFLRRKISGVPCKRTIWSCGTGGQMATAYADINRYADPSDEGEHMMLIIVV